MSSKGPPALREFLLDYPTAVQSLALGLRTVVLEELAPCHEYIFRMRSKVVLLYGSSDKVIADCVCSIATFSRHVTLSFHRGVELQDKYGLLRGNGKALRHLRVLHLAELDRPVLRAYLRQARRHSPLRRVRRGTVKDVITRVKASSAQRSSFPRLF